MKKTYKIPGRKPRSSGALTETQYKRMRSDLHEVIDRGLEDKGLWDELRKQQQTESLKAMFGALAIPLVCMHDEFGFGRERCARLMRRVIGTYKCVVEDYASIEDVIQIAKDELGIDVVELANEEL